MMFAVVAWIATVVATTTTVAAISHNDDPTAAPVVKERNNYIRVAPNCGVVCTKKPIKPSTRSPLNSPGTNTGGAAKQSGTTGRSGRK
jgi:hypothetical protein